MPAARGYGPASARSRLPANPLQGLPKQYRLLRGSDFQAVLRQRCSRRDNLFAVYAKPNGLPHARIGIAVSRKVSPHAVSRNRIKRQVREMFRLNHIQLSGLDLVIVAQPKAATQENSYLRAALASHWEGITGKCRK